MNSKWVKNFSISMSVFMLTGMLSGCNSSKSVSGTNEKDKSNAPLEFKMVAALYSDPPSLSDPFWTEWQKKTNTKLDMEWIPSADFQTKYSLMLNSGNIPEVSAVPDLRSPTLITGIQNGAFWDITGFLGDLSEYPNFKKNLAPDAFKYLSLDKKIYAVPRSRSRMDGGIKIRQDWLDKLNIPAPKTLDEYEAALKKIVSSDLDGNGKKDTIGLLSSSVPTGMFDAAFGALDPYNNAEGGLVETRLTPGYTDMIEWFRKLYSEGLMAKEFASIKDTQAIELFTTGTAASYTRSIWWDYEWEKTLNKTQPGAKLVNLTLQGPKGPAVELNTGVAGGYYISKKVPEEKVKKILKYFDQTASTELNDLGYYGIKDVHYKEVDGAKILTAQGIKEVNVTSKGAGVLAYSKWGKVWSASAPKAYNDAKEKEVGIYDEVGKINLFNNTLISTTWGQTWPKFDDEFTAMQTKAVVGQISMAEFKTYVKKLNDNPDLQKAFKEFAQSYKDFLSK
ncbi:MAG TPA: hypothetical protein VIK72_00635 [Clostridiaceae bacterium]